MGRDTYLCKDHANFKFMFNRLRSLKIILHKNTTEFIESICCHISAVIKNEDCMARKCKNCKNNKIISNDSPEPTWYFEWVTEKLSRKGAKNLI